MKKIVALILCVVMLSLCLTACGGGDLDGSYSCDLEIGDTPFSVITFDGDEVTTTYATGKTSKGKYELKDGKVICTYTVSIENGIESESESKDTFDYDADKDVLTLATMTWSKD